MHAAVVTTISGSHMSEYTLVLKTTVVALPIKYTGTKRQNTCLLRPKNNMNMAISAALFSLKRENLERL
jgi:hypothetical protein